MRIVHGRELRYLVLVALLDAEGPLALTELAEALADRGALVPGRPPTRSISDALRGEVRRGRVVRVARGRYGVGRIARSSARWFRDQSAAMARAANQPVDRAWIDSRAMRFRSTSDEPADPAGDDP